LSFADLFAEADRVGEKYQSQAEIDAQAEALAAERAEAEKLAE
jgi:hypothetical protein